jgi:hypothetical protein
MRWLLALTLTLLVPLQAMAYCVQNLRTGEVYRSDRVAHLNGEIPEEQGNPKKNPVIKMSKELGDTLRIPGDRILVITSVGGSERVGAEIIKVLLFEKESRGARLICVVDKYAYSMALMAHKIAMSGPESRMTFKNLRIWAERLEKADEPYRQQNAKSMHIGVREYDRFADADYMFTSKQLVSMGYLDGEVQACQ